MATAQDWIDVHRLKERAQANGFEVRLTNAFGYDGKIGLFATENTPVFATDAPIAQGNTQDLLTFIYGWESCVRYLQALKVTDPKKIAARVTAYKSEEIMEKFKGNTRKRPNL